MSTFVVRLSAAVAKAIAEVVIPLWFAALREHERVEMVGGDVEVRDDVNRSVDDAIDG